MARRLAETIGLASPYGSATGPYEGQRDPGLHRVAGKGLVYEEPKAERSRRTLALPSQLVEALRRHRLVQLEERVAPARSGRSTTWSSPR